MKYINTETSGTEISTGIERVVYIAPLDKFPGYDLDDPPPFTYAVEDDTPVEVGWIRVNGVFVSPEGDTE